MAVATAAVRILLLLLVSLQQQSALDVGSQRELHTAPPTTSPAAPRACSLSLPVETLGLLRLRGGLLASREALHAERERQQALSASSRATNGRIAVDAEGGGGGGGQGSGETPTWKDMCRICYDDDNKSDLFAPCMCSGSMGLVHRECLRQWRAVKVSERAFTHCSMCDHEYRLASDAMQPPSTRTHKTAKSLAGGECAVISTLFCLVVAVEGEILERLDYTNTLENYLPWIRRRMQDAGGMPTSPVPLSSLRVDPEEVILRRVRYSWVSLAVLSTCLLGMPFQGGINSGLRLYKTYLQFIKGASDKVVVISSVIAWLLIYAGCEIAFIHIHKYPSYGLTHNLYKAMSSALSDLIHDLYRAMASTLSLYLAVASLSPFIQWALQVYVQSKEQPHNSDVLAYQAADDKNAM